MWMLQWFRRRWGTPGVTPPSGITVVPPPRRIEFQSTTTTLGWVDDNGVVHMAQPVLITAGETGDLALVLVGADGARQDVTGATCTFRLVRRNGTVYANAVSLTVSDGPEGEVTWDRLTAQVQDAGDYRCQVKVLLSGSTDPVYFPNSNPNGGSPLTILAAV